MRVGPVSFRIGSDWAAPIDHLRRLYAAYPAPEDGVATATVRLEATRPWRRWMRPSVRIAGDYTIPDALPLPLAQGLLAAEMAMNLQVALGWRRHLLFHASAVERDGRAILMVGASGSGKSTLAAMLGESGWRLMGDEFALLAPESDDVFAFPRLVSLKNEGIAALAERVTPDRLGPLITGTPKGAIRHLAPRADAVARMDEGARPALILFPTFGGEPGLRPVPPSEAFLRLTDSSTNYVALGEAGFAALARLVRAVPCVAAGYASGAEGMAAVEALWAELDG
jgi:HprK-related kinase A